MCGQEKHSLWQRCDQTLSRPIVIQALFLTFLLLTIGDFKKQNGNSIHIFVPP